MKNYPTARQYERGDGRNKHRWAKDEAGFVEVNGSSIGKCHKSINQEVAQKLLNDGIVYNAPGSEKIEHIYATYRGIIYEAAPTQPDHSFHGYPWRGNQGQPALPKRIIKKLRQQAKQNNFSNEFDQWLKTHSN